MERSDLLDAQVQTKKIYNLLTEVLDLSGQLAEALDREDQVAVRMLLAMRGEPVNKLRMVRLALEQQRDALGEEDGVRLARLLNGEPAQEEAEVPLADQVAANTRLLKQVLELDQRLNRKVTREKSVYNENISPIPG